MGGSESTLKGKELVDHNWNHATRIISVIAGIWFVLNVVGILAFAIFVDKSAGNIIPRLAGFGRSVALFSGYEKLQSMEVRMDLLQQQIDKLSPQKGGSRKGLYSIKLVLVYLNLCFILGCIVFLTLFPSYLSKEVGTSTKTFNIPSFNIY